jgi:hypothetical protein
MPPPPLQSTHTPKLIVLYHASCTWTIIGTLFLHPERSRRPSFKLILCTTHTLLLGAREEISPLLLPNYHVLFFFSTQLKNNKEKVTFLD